MTQIARTDNQIRVEGDLPECRRLLATIHACVEKLGYLDLELDLSDCTKTFPEPMLAICAQIMNYREANVYTSLKLPRDREFANLFLNTNWAHLIDPRAFDPSRVRLQTRVPVTQYRSTQEQQETVNRIVNVVLGAVPEMQRSDFAAFEWSINEITDNVLVHSDSNIGGLIQIATLRRNEKFVKFVVADAGIGIPNSLRQSDADLTDLGALDAAIKEGVTRDQKLGQGNGLFGSYQIASQCHGLFSIDSGHAHLMYSDAKGLTIHNEKIPYSGTIVSSTIDFSEARLLENALKFKGVKHQIAYDFVDHEYDTDEQGHLVFVLKEQTDSFGSRVSGRPIRNKLKNLLRMQSDKRILIDLRDIHLISSSFADEAFAKLFLEVGPVTFMQKFEFAEATKTVRSLIDKAIGQRMTVGKLDDQD